MKSLSIHMEGVYEQVIKHRRHLHQHPELSFQEYNTSKYIQGQLAALDIPFQVVAKTGVVAFLQGKKNDATEVVVLRADMDALPIQEENEIDYRSMSPGVMHACGHDFHTANLLGVASVLKNMTSDFSGKIVLLFQHAEERIPGGAIQIIDSGVFEMFGGEIKAVIGLHVSPRLPLGKIGVRPGTFMASSDELYIRIKGKGGHAAEPHRAVDPIMIASQLLVSLQQVVSRQADPNTPSVLTFGRIIGDGAANVIPEEVSLAGTFRTLDECWRKIALQQIETLVTTLPIAMGARVDCQVLNGYPSLYNDPDLVKRLMPIFYEYLGKEQVEDLSVWMAAEDFAYYSQRYPSLFLIVGTHNDSPATQHGLHNSHFNLDEQAFKTAMPVLIHTALSLLGE